jgi:photosystem II stability/assembly factor-like uncharacterized protein
MTRVFLVFPLVLALSTPILAAPRRRSVMPPPLDPPCSMIIGTSSVTFTHDEGRTLVPASVPLHGTSYTYGLTALLDTPRTLAAWHDDDLLISSDAGCTWRAVATVTGADFPPFLTPARGGRLYAWSDSRTFLVRWDSRGAATLKPPTELVGLRADANDADHVRVAGSDGTIHESRDGGQTWTRIGQAPSSFLYRAAFDPQNLDRVLVGTLANGIHRSLDGGRTWTMSLGMPRQSNVFSVVISPVDSNVVWAMGIDLADSSKHIYLSRDGGASFTRVVDASAEVTLVNGPAMAAHPAIPDVLYFVFGTYFQGYGTDLFRYDAATRTLTMTHNDNHDINAIAFSSDAPGVIYLGLEREDR